MGNLTQCQKTRAALMIIIVCALGLSFPGQSSARVAFVQESDSPDENSTGETSDLSEAQQLEAEQKRLADRYKLLEEKLFSLHEFEKGTNPGRSKLLERAFLQSQEKTTASQMRMIVKLLTKAKMKDAVNEQEAVLVQLNSLLELLQSEDRGKRVRDEIQRNQDYLKEVERILRIQKGIRGQAEGGVDAKRLANSESKAAERTAKLADEIRENEESGEEPPGSQGQSQPGQPGESGGQGESDSESPQSESSTRKRIQAAEKKMRDAKRMLEQARRDEAIEAMKEAEREMALAKKELEEILRQLREEEIERSLAMLEGRFRLMLERQVRVCESTQKLDRTVPEQRGTDFEIRSGKLSIEQGSIATEAARALLLLREDGSSVAFPATVDEMHQDMLQVASRLSAAKIGRITIEIEEDIVDTLDYLIEALVQTQEDMERMNQQSQNGGGQPGDKPLVDQLAEIKMLRGLQERIFRRHRRYARFLDDPEDDIGNTDDPELQAALLRLAEKQAQLTDIARDIVNEKNK